jgi:hypothetical protein
MNTLVCIPVVWSDNCVPPHLVFFAHNMAPNLAASQHATIHNMIVSRKLSAQIAAIAGCSKHSIKNLRSNLATLAEVNDCTDLDVADFYYLPPQDRENISIT